MPWCSIIEATSCGLIGNSKLEFRKLRKPSTILWEVSAPGALACLGRVIRILRFGERPARTRSEQTLLGLQRFLSAHFTETLGLGSMRTVLGPFY